MEIIDKNIDGGKSFDWGRASCDYAKYRDIYPKEFYDKIINRSLCIENQTVLDLETGRTNQIRAHLSHVGYTIAGDTLFRAKTDPFRRLCLHAKTLEFYHPVTGELLSFSEEPPAAWENYCKIN